MPHILLFVFPVIPATPSNFSREYLECDLHTSFIYESLVKTFNLLFSLHYLLIDQCLLFAVDEVVISGAKYQELAKPEVHYDHLSVVHLAWR